MLLSDRSCVCLFAKILSVVIYFILWCIPVYIIVICTILICNILYFYNIKHNMYVNKLNNVYMCMIIYHHQNMHYEMMLFT